jgi:hypothetical protein
MAAAMMDVPEPMDIDESAIELTPEQLVAKRFLDKLEVLNCANL